MCFRCYRAPLVPFSSGGTPAVSALRIGKGSTSSGEFIQVGQTACLFLARSWCFARFTAGRSSAPYGSVVTSRTRLRRRLRP